MIDLSQEALRTVGGVAVFVLLAIQLLVKPAVKRYKDREWYGIGINTVSVVLGVGAALLAQVAIGPVEFASTFDAGLTGFSGAALAVLGYEGITNTLGFINSK